MQLGNAEYFDLALNNLFTSTLNFHKSAPNAYTLLTAGGENNIITTFTVFNMAAVLPPKSPSSLLQRRLSQAQYSSIEMAGLMSTFNMSFRPDAAAATMPATYPFSSSQQQHQVSNNAHSMAPSELVNPQAVQPEPNGGLDSSFSMPHSLGGFNGGSFGNLSWAPPPAGRPFTGHPGFLIRNERRRSNDGEPYIKVEEDSQVQPCQVLYDASAYSTSHDSASPMESSDDS